VIDSAVDELLGAAAAAGAQTTKFYLVDEHIEFCTNCRSCTQQAGEEFGRCVIDDRMRPILDEIERSDAIILASPMNFGTVTAVMKRFIERLVCFAYWPWGKMASSTRKRERTKRAVVVASSAAPALLARLFTSMVGLLKQTARSPLPSAPATDAPDQTRDLLVANRCRPVHNPASCIAPDPSRQFPSFR
jgi:hypothetical protein